MRLTVGFSFKLQHGHKDPPTSNIFPYFWTLNWQVEKNGQYFIPLTALWAFVESGLGGMMHALHLPFTGIFLGGFSVLSISLIGRFETKPFRQILKATLLVMVVKASVNPATSPMAYIAVGFQGLLGAVLYGSSIHGLLTALCFSILAMLESAFQKFLILTIIFGDAWYKAIDKFFHSILKSIGFKDDVPYALYLVSAYMFIYLIWGIVLGIWIHQIPRQINSRMHLYTNLELTMEESQTKRKSRNRKRRFVGVLALFIFLSCFLIPDENPWVESLTLVLRTATVVVVWFLILLPVWKRVITNLRSKKLEETPEILERIPLLRASLRPLFQEVSRSHRGIRRWKELVLGLLVISLRNQDV